MLVNACSHKADVNTIGTEPRGEVQNNGFFAVQPDETTTEKRVESTALMSPSRRFKPEQPCLENGMEDPGWNLGSATRTQSEQCSCCMYERGKKIV